MTNKAILLLAVFLLISSAALAQERYVRPFDEAKLDPSFLAFRTKLITAVERHDAAYIIRVLDPKIELSFGGDAGIADFKRIWKVNDKNSQFWGEFLAVIKNGGSFLRENGKRSNKFFAPYTFNGFPEDVDAFEHSVIFGDNVNLRASPDMNGEIVARLSYNIVKPDHDNSILSTDKKTYRWVKVVTLGGKQGYVNGAFVRSPIDYRAGFEKKRGVWKMVVFIAGD